MITGRLAEFATGFADDAVPDAAIARAGDALVDTLGVALAGSRHPVAALARTIVPAIGEHEASVWGGDGAKVRAGDAAFLNAVHTHALDFDDSSPALRGHPSCTLMPVAVAVGEATGASGRSVLASYAIGLEVASRISSALGPGHYLHGWHTTVTAGIFGATAIAGRLLGLDREALCRAFGLAASRASGLTRNFGTMAKPLHAGDAARAAIEAVHLARCGFTADAAILDGPQNFIAVYGRGGSPLTQDSLESLGERWTIVADGIFVKRWPCCYAVHRPVAALQALIDETGLKKDEIVSVEVGFLPGVEHPLKHRAPTTGSEARFSIEYAIAATLLDGDLSLASFADDQVRRPEAQALMARVRRFSIPHEGMFNGLTGFTELVVETTAGTIRRRYERTPGSPEWPLSPDEQAAKFLGCAALALDDREAHDLLGRARSVAGLADIRALYDPVTTPASSPEPLAWN